MIRRSKEDRIFVKEEFMSSFASMTLIGEKELSGLLEEVNSGKVKLYELTEMKPVTLSFKFEVSDTPA